MPTTPPCRVCGATVALLRSTRDPADRLVDQLRVCTNPECLSNSGSQGSGPDV